MPAVQLPFACVVDDGVMTISETLLPRECVDEVVGTGQQGADSTVAEQMWQALRSARSAQRTNAVAELEDAIFRLYLPMARTLAGTAIGGSVDHRIADHAAELGLAQAVLAWQQPTSGGFRRFARATIMRQLQNCVVPRPQPARKKPRAGQSVMVAGQPVMVP